MQKTFKIQAETPTDPYKFSPNFSSLTFLVRATTKKKFQILNPPKGGKMKKFIEFLEGEKKEANECHDEINLITNKLNLICLLAIFQVIKITRT
jgi:hypothetical protein